MVFKQQKIKKLGLSETKGETENKKKLLAVKLFRVRSHVLIPETPGRLRQTD